MEEDSCSAEVIENKKDKDDIGVQIVSEVNSGLGRKGMTSLAPQAYKLPTTGYTVKWIADVIKRSRKPIMNFQRHQEEYGTKKSSGQPSKLNDREKREVLRTAQ
uniref:HTH psq-type domain-containing protein n=1 Tax=Heterorhabditis bacteriophora TaxID=37862 RepID=A0A1I7WE95_HETBA